MMTRGRARREQESTGLCVLQVNVGKCGPAHDTALELAYQAEADIVLIQEP